MALPQLSPRTLAPYACKPEESRGRQFLEPTSPTRSVFQRDRDRIIHSAAFRRLKYKTQVFVYHEGDNYRTRLSHSLEVSQIARSISRCLGLDEDLAEALALAHDLGHPPFGHVGGDALNKAMKDFDGFDHNAQSLRVITKLEQRYAEFDGLNLTWESLEGIAKHNGPLIRRGGNTQLPPAIAAYNAENDLELDTYAGLEAQVAALSDDIAYNNHDIDDGLRARLFSLDELASLALVEPVFAEVDGRYPNLERQRLNHEVVRRLISLMVDDVLAETQRRLEAAKPASVADIRAQDRPMVAFSDAMADHDRELKAFLFKRMYRHDRVNQMSNKARRVVGDLFGLFLGQPGTLPEEWQSRMDGAGTAASARIVADYIAGMTDRYALDEHHRLFESSTKQ